MGQGGGDPRISTPGHGQEPARHSKDGVTRRCSQLAGARGRAQGKCGGVRLSARLSGLGCALRTARRVANLGRSRAISGDLGRSRAVSCDLVRSRAISGDLVRSRGISSAHLHHSIAACPRVGQSPRPASRGERSTSPCLPAYGEAAALYKKEMRAPKDEVHGRAYGVRATTAGLGASPEAARRHVADGAGGASKCVCVCVCCVCVCDSHPLTPSLTHASK